MKKLSKIVCLLMALVLMIVMTACGSKKESTEEPVTDAQTEEQASTDEASDDYDIAANLKLMGDPLGGTWDYDYDSKTSITFYNIAGREADCGGRLFSLVAYEPDDDSYKGLPHYSVVGESGGKVYVAEYPSDVQADVEVEEHMEQYQTVYAEVGKIEAKTADSPLVLK